eukprot:scaffold6922_cov363-Prasinococcus_capsulatus_cf.AAC.2
MAQDLPPPATVEAPTPAETDVPHGLPRRATGGHAAPTEAFISTGIETGTESGNHGDGTGAAEARGGMTTKHGTASRRGAAKVPGGPGTPRRLRGSGQRTFAWLNQGNGRRGGTLSRTHKAVTRGPGVERTVPEREGVIGPSEDGKRMRRMNGTLGKMTGEVGTRQVLVTAPRMLPQ